MQETAALHARQASKHKCCRTEQSVTSTELYGLRNKALEAAMNVNNLRIESKNKSWTWTGVSLGALMTLTACSTTSLSGIGGEGSFKCKAPEGVQCQSVSGNYANARAGSLPSQQSTGASGTGTTMKEREAATSTGGAQPLAINSGAAVPMKTSAVAFSTRSEVVAPLGAIRSDPTVIRIWVAPWEDADGDLMDQTYVYLPIDSGRWLIEHNRQRIKKDFAPVRAPTTAMSPALRPAPREDEANAPDSAAALAASIARARNAQRSDSNAPGATQ
jgi:conjugal transfer pilus assembly protein TraV